MGCDALIGAACSSASISAARMAMVTGTPQVSYASTSPKLSGNDFPYFARVVSSDSLMAVGLAEATRTQALLGFERVATIACTDAYCSAGMAAFEAAAFSQGITVVKSVSFENGQSNLSQPLAALRASRATVFVAIALPTDADPLLEQALDLGLAGPEFTWVGDTGLFEGLGSLADRGFPVDDFRGMVAMTSSVVPSVAYDGYASRKQARPSTLGNGTICDPAVDDEGHTLWSIDTGERGGAPLCFGADNQFPESVYAPNAYDAVYAVAYAVHSLVEDPNVEHIDGNALMAALLNVRFEGVTGNISFSTEPATLGDRAEGLVYDVMNVNASGAWVKLGTWSQERSFAGNGQTLTRPTSDNRKPPDLASDTLRIGVFCDHPASSDLYETCQHVLHAIERINDKSDGFYDDLLPDHTIFHSMVEVGSHDSGCGGEEAVRDRLRELHTSLNGVVAIIGPLCSDDVAAVTDVSWRTANNFSTAVLAPASTAASLADTGAFPNLLRLSSNDNHVVRGFVELASHLGWGHICVLHDDSRWGRSVRETFASTFDGIILNPNEAQFSKAAFDSGNVTGSDLLNQLEGCQIILLAAYPNAQRAVFAAAYNKKRLWGQGYAWLNAYPTEAALKNPDGSVNSSAVRGSEGVLGLIESSGNVSRPYRALWDEASSQRGCSDMGPQSRPFCDLDDDPGTYPDYTVQHVNAAIQLAVAADAVIRNGASPDDADALFAAMLSPDGTVAGLSGPLIFDDYGDRLGSLNVVNYRMLTSASGPGRRLSMSVLLPSSLLEFSIVGSYSTATSNLDLTDVGALTFSGGTTVVPQHSSPPPPPPPPSPPPEPLLNTGVIVTIVLLSAVVVWFAVREWRRRREREHERIRRQWLRYLSTGQPVQLEPLIGGNEYHLFLSHAWRSGQDAMRVMKERLLHMTPDLNQNGATDDLKIFLDVDDLQSGRGVAEVAISSHVIVFLSDGYLTRPNTVRELLRAMTLGKPILAVFDEHSSYMCKDALWAAVEAACSNFVKWELVDDLSAWGALTPSPFEIFAALTAQPLLWTRVPAFLDVTLRTCMTPLVQPRARQVVSQRTRGMLSPRQPKAFSPDALVVAMETMQRSGSDPTACLHSKLYTQAGVSFTWERLTSSKRYRVYASPHNAGALELTQELSRFLRHLGVELEVTSSFADLASSNHMLLYLDKNTWTVDDQRKDALAREVETAMDRRVHLLLAHETAPFEYQPDAPDRHAGVRFEDLLDCVDGATPLELLQRQVWEAHARTQARTHART